MRRIPISLMFLLVLNAGSAYAARDKVALMPLQSGLGTPPGLGESWSPLMAQLISERGRDPLYAQTMKLAPAVKSLVAQCRSSTCYQDIGAALGAKQLVAGGVTREGLRYFLTLTLHDLATFKQIARAERTWAGGPTVLDRELGAALDELFGAPVAVAAVEPPPRPKATPVSAPQKEIVATNAPVEPKKAAPVKADLGTRTIVDDRVYLYRTPAITLTVAGAIGLAAGLGMLVASRVMIGPFEAAVRQYNSTPVRTQAQYDSLRGTEQTLGGLQIGTSVALGAGAAALTAGIVLLAIDGKPRSPIAFVPTGPGGAVVGSF